MNTYTQTLQMTLITCCVCGVGFGVPNVWEAKRREDHVTFWCPNGHGQSFKDESEAERLQRQLKSEQRYATRLNAQLTDERNHSRALKGVATKLRNRAVAGACPFCGEHVYQLARHVTRKHPDERPEPEDTEVTLP